MLSRSSDEEEEERTVHRHRPEEGSSEDDEEEELDEEELEGRRRMLRERANERQKEEVEHFFQFTLWSFTYRNLSFFSNNFGKLTYTSICDNDERIGCLCISVYL